MAPPYCNRAAFDNWRGRHVVGGRGAPRRAIRIWHPARRSLLAIHARDAGLCRRRCGDGTVVGPRRNFRSGQRWRGGAWHRLCHRRWRAQSSDLRAGPRADRIRQFRDAGSAHGRHFEMVRAPARRGGDIVLGRKLFRRCIVAADRAATPSRPTVGAQPMPLSDRSAAPRYW